MQKLTDTEIRRRLILSLKRRSHIPSAILEEVHVCNGNAIADVVAVYKKMHCYEIKGESDSINRINRQSLFYDQAFPLISLITTTNHLKKATRITPNHWGILLAYQSSDGGVNLKYVRAAVRNPLYRPEIALLSLWRSELIKLASNTSALLTKMNRQTIAAHIASSTPIKRINERVGEALVARSHNKPISYNFVPYMKRGSKLLASKPSQA